MTAAAATSSDPEFLRQELQRSEAKSRWLELRVKDLETQLYGRKSEQRRTVADDNTLTWSLSQCHNTLDASGSDKMIKAETRRISWLRPKNGRYILVTMTKEATARETVALQSWLRPALTHVPATHVNRSLL